MFKEEKKEKVQKTKSRQEAWRASSKKSKGQSQDLQTTVTNLHVGIDMRFLYYTCIYLHILAYTFILILILILFILLLYLQTTTVTDLHVGIDMRFCRSTFHPEDSSKSNLDVLKSHNLKKLQK